MNAIVKETQLRSVIKAIVYRILSVISIVILSLIFGASLSTAGKIGIIVIIVGTTIYYIHERLWILSSWLRNHNGLDWISRSIIKTVIYRIITMIAGIIVAKIMLTDDNSTATLFGISQAVINMTLFFIVERIFNRIQWGRFVEYSN